MLHWTNDSPVLSSRGHFTDFLSHHRHSHLRVLLQMERILSYGSRLAIPAAILLAGAQRCYVHHLPSNQSAMYDVKGGSRAVIFDRLSGVKKDVVEEGTHFLVPWLQKAIIYDVRTKPRNISTTTGSKDLQMVSLTLRVLHRPNVVELPRIYQVRQNFEVIVIGLVARIGL